MLNKYDLYKYNLYFYLSGDSCSLLKMDLVHMKKEFKHNYNSRNLIKHTTSSLYTVTSKWK